MYATERFLDSEVLTLRREYCIVRDIGHVLEPSLLRHRKLMELIYIEWNLYII